MIEQMENAGDDAIIGSAFDGFPSFCDDNPDGTVIAEGNLGIGTGQPDDAFCYRCPTTPEAS